MAKRDKFTTSPVIVVAIIITLLLIGFGAVFYISTYRLPKLQPKSVEEKISYQESTVLPDKFPVDFPIYPGAKIVSSWTNEGPEDLGISIVWESEDNLDKITEFYKSALSSTGWTVQMESSATGSQILSFEKGTQTGFLGITVDKAVTISLTLGLKK